MTTTGRWALAFALALALGAPAQAQNRPPAAERNDIERRVRARFAETVKSELGITNEQLDRLGRVQESFQQRRQELVRRDAALRRGMGSHASAPSDDESRDLLEELAAVREDEARLFRDEMNGMLEILEPAQVLRFYQLREQLMERVRRLRQDGPGRGGPAGGPLGPRPGDR